MINLYDILDAADGQLFGDPAAQIFNGFSLDARHVREGDLFVALKTETGDGHYAMEEAVERGAIGIMCKHPPTFDTAGITVVIMRDVEGALLRWAKYILNKHGTTVIGVTGGTGKSTARDAIAAVLGARYQAYNGATDLRGRFALPLALSKLTAQHELAVVEFNSTYSGEMAEMLAAVKPTVGVVPSLAQPEALPGGFFEEQLLIEQLPEDGLAVLNYDNPIIRQMKSRAASLTLSVDLEGTSFGADLIAYNIITGLDKTGFDLRYGSQRHIAKWVKLLGAHQLYAVLAALAVGLAFDVPLEQGITALTELEPLAGRMRPLRGANGSILIDDSYDSSPESVLMALDWLASVRPRPSMTETEMGLISPRGKIYVVLGDISDAHQPGRLNLSEIGRRIVDVAGVLVTEGELAAGVARAAQESGFPVAMTHITFSTPDTVAAVREYLNPKDLVLVKGNPNARMERVVADLLDTPADNALLVRQERSAEGDILSERPTYPTWVHVDMDAIAHNVRQLKEVIGVDCQLMAVVKADAYGHGAVPVSTTAVLNGADMLGVATLQEALDLRQAGITAPILLLGVTPTYAARQIVQQRIAVTLYDLNAAKLLNRAADELGMTVSAHVRVDVGASGLGLMPENVPGFFRGVMRLDRLKLDGLYAYLSGGSRDLVLRQMALFEETVGLLRASEFKFKVIHAAASGAALHLPETRLDMVRCGLALYGIQPTTDFPLSETFKPALAWKTTVAQVKRVQAGTLVGIGGAFESTRAQTLAILPVGMMDGFRFGPQHWGSVLVKGQRAPIVGQIGLYQSLIDVSKIGDVRAGDEVVIIGAQGEDRITVEEAAAMLDTSVYEVLFSVMARVPRIK